MGTLVFLLDALSRELALFAAIGFVIGGLGDFAVDLFWMTRSLVRCVTVYRAHARASVATLPPPSVPGRIVIFVPAWDEGGVIGAMLGHACATLGDGDWRLYVGAYPNDPATIAAARAVSDARIRVIVGDRPGPTTKAECLNTVWRALCDDERRDGFRAKAVVLHDAEDVLHSAEIALYDRMIERFALVQLPVLPLADPRSRWVSGHYLDEFAESHGKTIVVREALGAAVPSAGVGCAFARDTLQRIADASGGAPFDADSLTEDYELGLRIAALGGRTAFVRIPARPGGAVVAVRAHFPATLEAAVRQKARWITGIALSGWDRLGWRGGWTERWMRLHDRRALLAALVLATGYAAVLAGVAGAGLRMLADAPPPVVPQALDGLLLVCLALMVWRLALRFAFTTRAYGWREGLRAVPRTAVANFIAILAARRAVALYLRMRRDGVVRWDKTAHHFPAAIPAE